jgi:XTP/dITP diphosphohydrolase
VPRLLIATTNPGKLVEVRALLDCLPVTVLEPGDLQIGLPAIEETGLDYIENAALKATALARASGLWTLADDSGLEVDALGGAPGLHSARAAGPGRSDADRRRMLLGQLASHPRPWSAHFHCAVVLSSPGGSTDGAVGDCPGEIIPTERGDGGFGYDPIFLVAGTGSTMAELSLKAKNQVSHRAQAVRAILPALSLRLGFAGEL